MDTPEHGKKLSKGALKRIMKRKREGAYVEDHQAYQSVREDEEMEREYKMAEFYQERAEYYP